MVDLYKMNLFYIKYKKIFQNILYSMIFQNKIIPFTLHYKFLLSPSPHPLSPILNEEEERQFKSFLMSYCN